jgi:hypothetical protein
VLWARKALIAKDASIAKARKVSELNKGPWKVLYVRPFPKSLLRIILIQIKGACQE